MLSYISSICYQSFLFPLLLLLNVVIYLFWIVYVQADQGHLVLVYDLWGRGYSDVPDTYYDEATLMSFFGSLKKSYIFNGKK
jgi:hypothetical protein